MIHLRSSFLRRCYLRKFYHRMRGLVSKFFFRMMGLECSFSFRSLECKSYHRMRGLVSKFFFRMMGLECSFSFRSLERKSSFRRLELGCKYVHRKFYHHRSYHRMVRIQFFFVGLGRNRFSFVVGCSVGLERNRFSFGVDCSNLYLPFVTLGRIRCSFVGLGCSVGHMVERRLLSFVVGCSKY